ADGLFNTDERPKDIESPEINQGMLEGSNVKPIFEMARMITIHRNYDNIRNFIKREDERMRNMVKELGKT
ncbi:MAG: flagellar basal-body rod protein FlgF, partial [Proteobacteria bacterium]|nr:flagellar basal-body rod protein FlgF [Pseudomonadota bacterium]